jgi:hydrogenase maturation factor
MSAARANETACGDGHCITCADEAVAMTVLQVDGERELALAQAADGLRRSVETALVGAVAVGDVLLVHAGTAIACEPSGEAATRIASEAPGGDGPAGSSEPNPAQREAPA